MTSRERAELRATSEDQVVHIINRLRWAVVVFLLATLALIAGLGYAVYGVETVEKRVTQVESSPCVLNPSGPACQSIFRNAHRASTLEDACIELVIVMTEQALATQTRCSAAKP